MAKLTGGGSNKYVSPGIRQASPIKRIIPAVPQIKSVRQQHSRKNKLMLVVTITALSTETKSL